MATLSGMSGHTIIEDRVIIGGMVGSHQWVRIGTLAMVSGYSKISMDVPPYSLVDGKPARVVGPNQVGLRRSGLPQETRRASSTPSGSSTARISSWRRRSHAAPMNWGGTPK